jgi:hypothetical protein
MARLPLFLHAYGVVPPLRATIDSSERQGVGSYATNLRLLYVRGVAQGDGTVDFFDGGRLEQTPTSVTSRRAASSTLKSSSSSSRPPRLRR